jgi:shikimate kinase
MNIILFGFKGSGKTHFGRLLARELKKAFIDTDDLIIELSNSRHSIREIHQILGEKQFRFLENAAIHTLTPDLDAVIALGGGAILNPDHVETLQKIGRLVYLQASFDRVQKRIFEQGLPSFAEAKDSLRKVYDERLLIYESIAAHRIETDQLDDASILAALKELSNGL